MKLKRKCGTRKFIHRTFYDNFFHIYFLLNQWKHVLLSKNYFQYGWDNHPRSFLLNGILGQRKPWGVIIITETFQIRYTYSQTEKQDQEAKIKLLFKCANLSVKCTDVVRYCYFDVLQIDTRKSSFSCGQFSVILHLEDRDHYLFPLYWLIKANSWEVSHFLLWWYGFSFSYNPCMGPNCCL